MFKQYQLRNYNFKLIILILITCVFGVFMINSADDSYTRKQMLGVIVCTFIMLGVSVIDYNTICKFWWVLYGINFVMLVAVKLFGLEVNGATRWFSIPGFGTIQPSEFSKIIMIVCVAFYIERHKEDLNTFKTLAVLAVLCAIPIGLIAIQTDLSTSLDIVLILLAIIFVGGLSMRIIGIALLVTVPALSGYLYYVDHAANPILIKDYQVDRIKSFLHPSAYSLTESYQQDNSVMAIGSGMLTGKGLNSSSMATVKQANLVSEQQTDFIFSIVGEELGFIGCMFVIAILVLIMLQCIKVARSAKNTSGMLIATGMAALIVFQSFMNIGVAIKLLPNTGLPLPFVSYGLSSLLSLSIGMGLVLNVSLQKRKY